MDNNYVRVDRQSICMGDDCTAPNEKLLSVGERDRLSDIFRMIADYLPQMQDVIWAVDSGKKVVGYILMAGKEQVRYELCPEDQIFCKLDIEAFHCSYFHRRSFEYRAGEDGETVEKYPECGTLFDKVKRCMEERFLYKLELKGGSLCIWGEWFGRPHDNFHVIETVQWEKDGAALHFKDGGALYVSDPAGIVNEKERLIIRDASRVLWTWYSYGRERTYENLYVRQYTKSAEGEIMRAEGRRGDIKNGDGTKFCPLEENAVFLG